MTENLLNYDPEDVQKSPQMTSMLSSPKRRSLGPLSTVSSPQSSRKRGSRPLDSPSRSRSPSSQVHSRTARQPRQKQSTPSRTVTPPLAMPEASSTSHLSFTEQNSMIMAIQEQVDWNVVATASGVGVDRVMKWWMKARSEIIRSG